MSDVYDAKENLEGYPRMLMCWIYVDIKNINYMDDY